MKTKHLFVLYPPRPPCIFNIWQQQYQRSETKNCSQHLQIISLFIPKSIKFDYFDAHRWDEAHPWKLVCAHICHQGHIAQREDKYDIYEILNN